LIHLDSWKGNGGDAESLKDEVDDASIWSTIFPGDSTDEPPSRR
jgi:hypothetical protein